MRRRFLFASAPLAGHLDWGGYLQTAAHLSRSGHEVIWVSEEQIRASVEASGVTFQAVEVSGWRWPPARSEAEPADSAHIRFQRALDVTLSEDAVAQATQNLLDIARRFKPAAIIGEPLIGSAAIVAEQLDVPYAVCGYPATPPEEHGFVEPEYAVAAQGEARLKRLFEHFRVPGRNWPGGLSPWPQSPELHVVYWTREWYADEVNVRPQTQFVGGVVAPASGGAPGWFDRIPPNVPLALITLGSIFTDDPDFFVIAAQASVRAGLFPIIAMGRSDRAPSLKQQLAPCLPRCIAVWWVDYDHLFPRLAVAIHHGGMGTAHAAVVHGVPQMIVPHAADQGLQARRAEASGVGLIVAPKDAALESMQRAIETVVRDPAFRIRAAKLSAAFARAGGVPRAAEWIGSL